MEQLLVFANESGGVWPLRKGTWCKVSGCGFAKWLHYQLAYYAL